MGTDRNGPKSLYCISGNFRENFIFVNSVKRHTCAVKNLRLGQNLPISVIDSVFLRFLQGFHFHETSHMQSFAKIEPSRKFPNLQ